MRTLLPLTALAVSLWLAAPALASSTLPVQGVVRDNAGALIADGAFAMTFALYASADAEAPLWLEEWPPGATTCASDPAPGCVQVEAGVFTVLLGTSEPLAVATLIGVDQLYLGISVEGEPELPRRPLGAAARAITTAYAEVAGSLDCSGCIPTTALDFDLCDAAASCGLAGPVDPADLPADGLDEVSNGTLSNQLERTWTATGLPTALAGTGSASITVAASGTIESIAANVTLTYPGAADLRLELLPPSGGAPIILAQPGSLIGPEVIGQWTDADVLASLAGSSPAGTWTLLVTDVVPNGNEDNAANSLTGFWLEVAYLAADATEVSGDLIVSGEVQSPSLDALAAQVAELQAEVWCLHTDCVEDCPEQCSVCTCDGFAQACVPTGPKPDGTPCEAGGEPKTCQSGACPTNCGLLGVECPIGFACVLDAAGHNFCQSTDGSSVYVPGGDFWMGCNVDNTYDAEACSANEKPRHLVSVAAFAIDRTEVTAGAYSSCVAAGTCDAAGTGTGQTYGTKPDHPINFVDYTRAQQFCAWRAGVSQPGWRLCTEAEWEMAARGGCDTVEAAGYACQSGMRVYPWSTPGSSDPATCDHAWMDDGGGDGCGAGTTTTTADSMPQGASPYGALHMAGNVREWVEDCWHGSYNGAPVTGDEWVCSSPASQTLRGGTFHHGATFGRGSARYEAGDNLSKEYVGFRCCRSYSD